MQQCGSKDAVLTAIRLRFAGPKANINEVSNKVLALYHAFRRQVSFGSAFCAYASAISQFGSVLTSCCSIVLAVSPGSDAFLPLVVD